MRLINWSQINVDIRFQRLTLTSQTNGDSEPIDVDSCKTRENKSCTRWKSRENKPRTKSKTPRNIHLVRDENALCYLTHFIHLIVWWFWKRYENMLILHRYDDRHMKTCRLFDDMTICKLFLCRYDNWQLKALWISNGPLLTMSLVTDPVLCISTILLLLCSTISLIKYNTTPPCVQSSIS